MFFRWTTWRQKCEDDSETKNWMQANTKPCPKCGKPVEKNGGCNLVTCLCSQVQIPEADKIYSNDVFLHVFQSRD
jgi:hypothetical protein